MKGDLDASVRIGVCHRGDGRSLSLNGSWIANERVKEHAHVVDLCGHPHRWIYADVATMRSGAVSRARLPDLPRV